MSRPTVRNTTLSLDSAALIRRLYPAPRTAVFWQNHLMEASIGIANFYSAMRGDPISEELEKQIESGLEWDLRKIGIDRDALASTPDDFDGSLLQEAYTIIEGLANIDEVALAYSRHVAGKDSLDMLPNHVSKLLSHLNLASFRNHGILL